MSHSNPSRKCLYGYRIGLFSTCEDYYEQRLRHHDAETLRIKGAATEQELKAWWGSEVERAREDQITLIVVDKICHCGRENCTLGKLMKSWVEKIEEEAFFASSNSSSDSARPSVQFVRSTVLSATMYRSKPLEDAWGDLISPGNLVDVDEQDINWVMSQASCSREKAVVALKENKGDSVDAIMALVRHRVRGRQP